MIIYISLFVDAHDRY